MLASQPAQVVQPDVPALPPHKKDLRAQAQADMARRPHKKDLRAQAKAADPTTREQVLAAVEAMQPRPEWGCPRRRRSAPRGAGLMLPWGRFPHRWWDGKRWTEWVSRVTGSRRDPARSRVTASTPVSRTRSLVRSSSGVDTGKARLYP